MSATAAASSSSSSVAAAGADASLHALLHAPLSFVQQALQAQVAQTLGSAAAAGASLPPAAIKSLHKDLAASNWGVEAAMEQALGLKEKRASPNCKIAMIPSLNSLNAARDVSHLRPNQLVRFRGMIQETFQPDFYSGLFQEKSSEEQKEPQQFETVRKHKPSQIRTGKYRDVLDVEATNVPAHEHMMERLSINVVPIPGESSWVEQAWRKMEAQSGHTVVQPTAATANAKKTGAPAAATGSAKKKRGLDGGEPETMDDAAAAAAAPAAASSSAASELSMGDDPALAAHGGGCSSSSSAAPAASAAAAAADSDSTPVKKGKSDSGAASAAAAAPTPGQAGSPRLSDHGLEVIVTLYDGLARSQAAPAASAASSSSSAVAARAPLRVGDMYEFIGVLSLTPDLKVHLEDVDQSMEGMGAELWSQRRSQALRMHALAAVKIEPGFPFIADPTADAALFATQRQELLPVLPNVRAALLGLLTAVLGGDALAGETLLLFLLQRLHSRGSAVGGRLGKLVLNLVAPAPTAANPAGPSQLVARLAGVLQSLLPRLTQLEVNIGALNAQVWQPKKNYEDESLDSNLLHLASPSCLLLDETRLAAGTLSAVGLTNLRVLSKLLSQSSLEYDFQFQSLDFPVEYSALIVSAGAKSLVHQDGQAGIDVTLRLQATAQALYEQSPALPALSAQDLDFFRAYLLMCRSASFDINAAMSAAIENHFVALRQLRPAVTNEATLHLLLNLARLYSLSHGESELASMVRWNEITRMFEQLHQRAQ